MVRFKSEFTESELIARWDEFTSISRFAGVDDVLDLIYTSKRNGNKVRLVRKSLNSREPFSAIFRGKIRKHGTGSVIVGHFTKSLFDYILITAIFCLLFYIRLHIILRNESLDTINSLLVIAIITSALLLYNFRATKRKYEEFISRITGTDEKIFISRFEKLKNKD